MSCVYGVLTCSYRFPTRIQLEMQSLNLFGPHCHMRAPVGLPLPSPESTPPPPLLLVIARRVSRRDVAVVAQ